MELLETIYRFRAYSFARSSSNVKRGSMARLLTAETFIGAVAAYYRIDKVIYTADYTLVQQRFSSSSSRCWGRDGIV